LDVERAVNMPAQERHPSGAAWSCGCRFLQHRGRGTSHSREITAHFCARTARYPYGHAGPGRVQSVHGVASRSAPGKALSVLHTPVTEYPVTVSDSSPDGAAWRATAAYLYVLQLDGPSLAWEYVRRNVDYRRDWQTRIRDHAAAARWDLQVLEDPQLDARAATPLWLAREPVSTRSTSHAWDLREIDELAVWTRAGGRLFHDGERVLLMDPRCRRAAICASPRALAHLRMLQARDGVLAGASQREIAIGLFGDDRVTSQWLPDSALRAQVRRYLQRARAYSSGEYRALVRPVVVTARVSKSSLTSPSQPEQTHGQRRSPAEPLPSATEPATMPSEPWELTQPYVRRCESNGEGTGHR